MEDTNDFNTQVIQAVEQKIAWYDSTMLPKIQDDYRLHLTCVHNIYEALLKKSLLTADPYKKDKKVTKLVPIESTNFSDNDRAVILGIRLSDYENTVEFICNYMKFSVEQLNTEHIKQLLEMNSTFTWGTLNPNSPKPNTKALANCIGEIKSSGADPLTISLIGDSIAKTNIALKEIEAGLKSLAEFQKIRYKSTVRQNVLTSPQFNKAAAATSVSAFMAEIKRLFPSCMPKKPYAVDMIQEIANEEVGPNKDQLRSKLLATLEVEKKQNSKKQEKIDIHFILMEAVRTLGSTGEQYDQILTKIISNHDILESEHNSFMDKLKRFLRKAFGIAEPSVDYDVVIIDTSTQAKHKEKVHYNEFVESLSKRSKFYSSFSARKTPGYNRINAQGDGAIIDFLNKHMIENNHMMALLSALDDFFKNAASAANRSKIKGIKMELTSLKNILVKTNQQRAEYLAYAEEQEQMKKLGISND